MPNSSFHALLRLPATCFGLVTGGSILLRTGRFGPGLLLVALGTAAALRASVRWATSQGGSRPRWAFLVAAVLFFCSGWITTGRWLLTTKFPHHLDGATVRLEARVLSSEAVSENRQRLVVEAVTITVLDDSTSNQQHQGSLPGRVVAYLDDLAPAAPCQAISLLGTLEPLPGRRNPGGFDARFYWARRGVQARLVVSGFGAVTATEAGCSSAGQLVAKCVTRLRGRVGTVFNAGLGPELAGLAHGLLLGDTSTVPPADVEAFQRAGLVHLLAVSGLHVGFVAATVQASVRRIVRLPLLSLGAVLLLVGGFVVTVGAPASAVRAAVMLALGNLAVVLKRPSSRFGFLSWAAVVLLLSQPGFIFDMGFQLSVAAAAGIMLVTPALQGRLGSRAGDSRVPGPAEWGGGWETLALGYPGGDLARRLWKLLTVTAGAQLGTLPVLAWHFNRVTINGFVSNPLLVPAVAWVFPGLLAAAGLALALPSVTAVLVAFARPVFWLLLQAARLLATLPGGALRVRTPPWPLVVAYYVAVGYATFFRGSGGYSGLSRASVTRQRALRLLACVALAATIIWLFVPESNSGRLEVAFLDVGQGDAAVIHTPCDQTLVMDAGSRAEAQDWDAGRDTVVPALYKLGWLPVDWVIVSHLHDDHTGGMQSLLERMTVRNMALPVSRGAGDDQQRILDELLLAAATRGTVTRLWVRGTDVDMGCGVRLTVLSPPAGVEAIEKSPVGGSLGGNANHHSMVVRLQYGDFVALFTGDLEAPGEKALLAWQRAAPGSSDWFRNSVLKVSHHGSSTSSTSDFLDELGPGLAVVPVGPNPHGLPSSQVIGRLRDHERVVLRTDEHGAIMVSTDGTTVNVWSHLP